MRGGAVFIEREARPRKGEGEVRDTTQVLVGRGATEGVRVLNRDTTWDA